MEIKGNPISRTQPQNAAIITGSSTQMVTRETTAPEAGAIIPASLKLKEVNITIKEKIQYLRERHAIVCGITVDNCKCGWYPCSKCALFKECIKRGKLDNMPLEDENYNCFRER